MNQTSIKKYQIFVSSTYDDLVDERKQVVQAILKCNCIPAGMELWPGSSRSQWEVIKAVIDESDYYLVIIAGRYGSEGINEYGEKVSFTEMEFDYALQSGKPIIALLHKYPDALPVAKSELNEDKRRKLDAFREKAKDGRLIHYWTSKEDLITEAVLAINSEIKAVPTKGWMRCPSTDDTVFSNVINVMKPKSFNDCTKACNALLNHELIALDLNGMDIDQANRFLDMLCGTAYGEFGHVQSLGRSIFIIAPNNVEIQSDLLHELSLEEPGKHTLEKKSAQSEKVQHFKPYESKHDSDNADDEKLEEEFEQLVSSLAEFCNSDNEGM